MDDAHLSTIIEGVESAFAVYGKAIRVVIPAEALQRHFGASAEPQSWLNAFNANTMAIEKAARRAQLKSGLSTVILSDF